MRGKGTFYWNGKTIAEFENLDMEVTIHKTTGVGETYFPKAEPITGTVTIPCPGGSWSEFERFLQQQLIDSLGISQALMGKPITPIYPGPPEPVRIVRSKP